MLSLSLSLSDPTRSFPKEDKLSFPIQWFTPSGVCACLIEGSGGSRNIN